MADAKIVLSAEDRTKAALDSAKRNLLSIGDQVSMIDARLGALGGAVVAAFSAASLRGTIDMLDRLDDLSEKTGISVESLSALRYAGESVGTPLEALATGARKLSAQMAEAASGNKEAAATFRSLNVEIKNSDGSLKAVDAVILELADRFGGLANGAQKSAFAQRLFGKSGEEMIPLLNQGRDGIEALTREAQSLGVVFSKDVAKAAADFNDNLKKITLAAEAASLKLGGPLLQVMGIMSERMLDAAKNGGLLKMTLTELFRFVTSVDLLKAAGSPIAFAIGKYQSMTSKVAGGGRGYVNPEVVTPRDLNYSDDKKLPANPELEKQARLLAELAGLTGSFAEDWARLNEVYKDGRINLDQLTKAQAALLSRQPAVRAEAEAQAKAEKELQDARAAAEKDMQRARDNAANARHRWFEETARELEAMQERNAGMRDEIEEIGKTGEALVALRMARIDAAIARERDNLLIASSIDGYEAETEQIRKRIQLLGEQRDLTQARGWAEMQQQQAEEARRRTEQLSESIEQGILTGFRNGQSAADIFVNELKAQFAKTILRPIISPIAAAGDAFMSSILSGFGGIFGGGSVLSGASAVNSFDSGAMSSILGFADGGRPPLGKVSIVGERGPELFVPDSAGTIIPNGKLGGNTTVVHQTIQMTVGDVATMQQVRQAIQSSQAASAAQLRRQIDYGGGLS